MLVANLRQLRNAAEHIGSVAQSVFNGLGGGVAGAGKGAEGSHIGEKSPVEAACVVVYRTSVHNFLSGLQRLRGDFQAGGKIVGGAGGDIAHGHVGPGHLQACHRLVEGAVTAAADHNVHIRPQLPGHFGGISLAGGHVHGDQVARLIEQFQNLHQTLVGPALAGIGIHNEKHFFHDDYLNLTLFKFAALL